MISRHTNSMLERQNIHPLERNDSAAFRNIDTVSLSFLEKAKSPLPRYVSLSSVVQINSNIIIDTYIYFLF